MIEVREMPEGAHFTHGVRFDYIYNQIPCKQRSMAGSWPRKIIAMGINIKSVYCSMKNNIHRTVHSPNSNKVFWIPVDIVKSVFPEIISELDEYTPSHPINTPDSIPTPDSTPTSSYNTTCVYESQDLIFLKDDEKFVGSDGSIQNTRVYGIRTRQGIYFNLSDLMEAFSNTTSQVPGFINPLIILVDGKQASVVNFWDFVLLASNWDRRGSVNARRLFDWSLDIVSMPQVQCGELPQASPQVIGKNLPLEFGKRVIGAYSFSFLPGSKDIVDYFPSLAARLIALNIPVESLWNIWKLGHTDNMLRRFGEHRRSLSKIHRSYHVQSGFFWSIPNKKLAASVETTLRKDWLCKYNVILDGFNHTELYIIPNDMVRRLQEDGQSITTRLLEKALNNSVVDKNALLLEHRDETDVLRNENVELRMDNMRAQCELTNKITQLIGVIETKDAIITGMQRGLGA